ncbi:MAG: alkylmercury lyase family protein [Deltaproteobacteria bacterium]|nr:alkylmercury lyase family protein [Deltaproteobacteria bacterium]
MPTVTEAVERLNHLLPLKSRQEKLPEDVRSVHRGILKGFVTLGRPLNREEILALLHATDFETGLKRLSGDDLVVLDSDGKNVIGAYPMTSEKTAHRLTVSQVTVNAMCALDALSVSPMFGHEVTINSHCCITGDPIVIHQKNRRILAAKPSEDVHVGVRWQSTCGCAAHSLCMEMVFLRDETVARTWQGDNADSCWIFPLPEAVEFGAAFFTPLMND